MHVGLIHETMNAVTALLRVCWWVCWTLTAMRLVSWIRTTPNKLVRELPRPALLHRAPLPVGNSEPGSQRMVTWCEFAALRQKIVEDEKRSYSQVCNQLYMTVVFEDKRLRFLFLLCEKVSESWVINSWSAYSLLKSLMFGSLCDSLWDLQGLNQGWTQTEEGDMFQCSVTMR